MSSAERQHLIDLTSQATAGPWWGGGDRGKQGGAKPVGLVGRLVDRGTGNAIAVLGGLGMDRVADAEFIAAARNQMPEILELLDAAEVAFRQIQSDHHSEPRRALYGRPGSMEMRCVVCNRPAPCSTWQIAQAQLEKLAA